MNGLSSLFTPHSSPQQSEALLASLIPALGESLHVDRCFLYLRNPQTNLGRVPFCWTCNSGIPTIYDEDWKPEPANLADKDPMFAAALKTAPSIYVEDVESANPQVLNSQFERENFGHRALVHGHVSHAGQLWGVLQPCMLGRTRVWSQDERAAIDQIILQITPAVVAYVKAHSPKL